MSSLRRDGVPLRFVYRDLGLRRALAEAWAQLRGWPVVAQADVVDDQVRNARPLGDLPDSST